MRINVKVSIRLLCGQVKAAELIFIYLTSEVQTTKPEVPVSNPVVE
jgi:hypothetical protein